MTEHPTNEKGAGAVTPTPQTPTEEIEMNSIIVPLTAEITQARQSFIEAHAPMVPGSERHSRFLTWLVERGKSPDYIAWVRECADAQRIGFEYGQQFGVPPVFPNPQQPAWATEWEDSLMTSSADEQLQRDWMGMIVDEEHVSVFLERTDWFDFETGAIEIGQTVMKFLHGQSDPVEFIDPTHAREAAAHLLDAVNRWETHEVGAEQPSAPPVVSSEDEQLEEAEAAVGRARLAYREAQLALEVLQKRLGRR